MWKKQKRCLKMKSLPHHVVEHIMDRLPVESLLRFKAVSKLWKSTIDSPFFQERQLKHGQQSGDPDVLLVSEVDDTDVRRLVLGSLTSVMKIPTPWLYSYYLVSRSSLDGLVCVCDTHESGFVVNPTTRWYRPFPRCGLQQLMVDLGYSYYELGHSLFMPGFGKDKFASTYKVVWLYNSSEIGLEAATTCEVFDFSTNAWRYVTPSAPYRIVGNCPEPVFVDGSLHWFTECEETKVISFDLHTEVFQVIGKAPFSDVHPLKIVLCNLNNSLCVSEMNWPNQVVWSFNSVNKTWDKICSIDLDLTFRSYGFRPICALVPLALIDGDKKMKKKKNKKKLLFYDLDTKRTLVTLDLETKSYDVAFSAESIGNPVCYFQSLISIS